MQDVARWFAEGGMWMYVVLLLAVTGLPGDVLALLLAVGARFVGGFALTLARVLSVGMLLFSGLPGLVGLFGWWSGIRAVNAAVAFADPSYRDQLKAVGYAEARLPMVFGGIVSTALVALALVACVVALAPRRSVDPDADA